MTDFTYFLNLENGFISISSHRLAGGLSTSQDELLANRNTRQRLCAAITDESALPANLRALLSSTRHNQNPIYDCDA